MSSIVANTVAKVSAAMRNRVWLRAVGVVLTPG